jgi:hypothetical protein
MTEEAFVLSPSLFRQSSLAVFLAYSLVADDGIQVNIMLLMVESFSYCVFVREG